MTAVSLRETSDSTSQLLANVQYVRLVSNDGFRLAFLTIGLTMACFMEDGKAKVVQLSDAFTSLATIVDIPALM